MLEMKCNLEKVLNTNVRKEAEVCTLTHRVQGMENRRVEWKTLEAEQTIELDVIRTALAETQTTSTTTESVVERGVELQKGQWTNRKKGRTPSLLRGEGGGLLNFLCFINKNIDCEKTRKGKI
jgi:hypothetical protein